METWRHGDMSEFLVMLYPVVRLLHNTELCRVNITNSDYPSARLSIRRFPKWVLTMG